MRDLRKKLREFHAHFPDRNMKTRRKSSDLTTVIPGEIRTNVFGEYTVRRMDYPLTHSHGKQSFKEINRIRSDVYGLIAKDKSLEGISIEHAIFMDTETTGLTGGTGTLAFLIGLGRFVEGSFIIEQFFIKDFTEERAVLHAISERIGSQNALISYNGKAYDLNILSSRFTLNRMENPFSQIPHLDLLFAVRRLWRRRIENCSLTHIETTVLNFQRQNDIPGSMIPSLYFDFLHTGDGEQLFPIFQHNCWDILSLVGLTALIGIIYQDPIGQLEHPQDFFSLGKAYEALCDHQAAALCFKKALSYPLEENEHQEILSMLSYTLKRMGQWEEASEIWRQLLGSRTGISPFEELAKYYEHHQKDFQKAIEVVTRALSKITILEALRPQMDLQMDKQSLEYRLSRLRRKEAKENKLNRSS
jgi:uncharacterized protein YprB with RNaseH-like and TPR domain